MPHSVVQEVSYLRHDLNVLGMSISHGLCNFLYDNVTFVMNVMIVHALLCNLFLSESR